MARKRDTRDHAQVPEEISLEAQGAIVFHRHDPSRHDSSSDLSANDAERRADKDNPRSCRWTAAHEKRPGLHGWRIPLIHQSPSSVEGQGLFTAEHRSARYL